MRGIDVHQDKGDPDWAKVRAAGHDFAWLKVSEGVGFPATDEWYRRNRAAATTSRSRPTATRRSPSSRPWSGRSARGRSSTPIPTPRAVDPEGRPAPLPALARLVRAERREGARACDAGGLSAGRPPVQVEGIHPRRRRGDVDLNELRAGDLDAITYRPDGPAKPTVRFELVHGGELVKASTPVKPGSLREQLALQTFLVRHAHRIEGLLAKGEVTLRRRRAG